MIDRKWIFLFIFFLLVRSIRRSIPLRCSSPIDFEFQVYIVEPHEAFSIHPLRDNPTWSRPVVLSGGKKMDEWLFFSSLSSELRGLHSFKYLSLLHVTTEREGCLWFCRAETVWVASSHVAGGALRAAFTLCQTGVRRDPNECLILEPFLGFLAFNF